MLNKINGGLMKKWIFILLSLALIISISGCTTSQAPPVNKTYSANGLSFVYPGNWSELDKTTYQSALGNKGELLAVVGDGSNYTFGVARLNRVEKDVSLGSIVKYYNSTLNGTEYVSGGSAVVNGVGGYEITVKASEKYLSGLLFLKNSTTYLAVFESSDNDQKLFNRILTTLKVF